jgi:hypothetical protein
MEADRTNPSKNDILGKSIPEATFIVEGFDKK